MRDMLRSCRGVMIARYELRYASDFSARCREDAAPLRRAGAIIAMLLP